jgi:hypothetical protein
VPPVDQALARRRTVLLTAAGAIVALTACEDVRSGAGTPSGSAAVSGSPTPSHDPAVVAAAGAAAGQIQQIVAQYTAVARRHPALKAQLATAQAHRAQHLARLRQLGAPAPKPAKATAKLPAQPTAALRDLASREQKLSVAHATAAAALSGPAARVLASIAAAEAQLAVTLSRTRAKAGPR